MLTAMTSSPSTPVLENAAAPPPPNRRLWSSPSFSQHSDYYSGDDGGIFSPEASFIKSAQSSIGQLPLRAETQNQRIILDRLAGIAKAILASPDLTEHHFQLIEQDVDRLEQTIAAPDPQSREPADVADSGLFVNDEDDVTEMLSEHGVDPEPEISISQTIASEEVVSRVVKVAQNLKKRFQEMKVCDLQSVFKIQELIYL
jgi:hypothetical protein